jgi:hypothetical protein
MAVLPTPGSPMRTAAPDQRVELVLHRRFGEVAAELGQQRRLFHPRERRLFVQERHDVLADRVQSHPFFHQDRRRDRTLLAEDAEQQVLGPDVVVQQPVGLFGRKLQDALGFGAEGDLDRGRDLLAKHGAPFDFFSDGLQGQMRAGEDPAGEALPLANQAQEEMLGFNGDTAEL